MFKKSILFSLICSFLMISALQAGCSDGVCARPMPKAKITEATKAKLAKRRAAILKAKELAAKKRANKSK